MKHYLALAVLAIAAGCATGTVTTSSDDYEAVPATVVRAAITRLVMLRLTTIEERDAAVAERDAAIQEMDRLRQRKGECI